MEPDSTVKVELKNDIPIGHKVALKDFKVGDTVISTASISARWSPDQGELARP